MVRCKVVEIRWHDMTPIFSADFHQLPPDQHRKPTHGYAHTVSSSNEPFKVAQGDVDSAGSPEQTRASVGQKMWRLATCGGDKHVRLWLVKPHPPFPPPPVSLVAFSPRPGVVASTAAPEPSVEYLATLRRHTAAVNVVRFNPKGEMLASASDDGNIIFWVPGAPTKMIGDTEEDTVFEREQWRAASYGRTPTGQEIYDLCFSPNGAHVAVGSIDHTVYFFDVAQGNLLHKIAEHSGFVQGVAWDPRNQFIATQSSDRSMHVYSVAKAGDRLSVHPVSKNTRMGMQYPHSTLWTPEPCPSSSGMERYRMTVTHETAGEPSDEASDGAHESRSLHPRRHSHVSSDVSDVMPGMSAHSPAASRSHQGPPSSATSSHEQDQPGERSFSAMDPPHVPTGRPLSRRSSTSSHPIRSPSPAPLPATRVPSSPTMSTAILQSPTSSPVPSPIQSVGGSGRRVETMRLYTDSNATFYFRRLAWSPDGSLLLTPAGLFEPPNESTTSTQDQPIRNSIPSAFSTKRKANEIPSANASGPRPTVYLYSRANITKPPVAHLPGHRTTSIAVRFCPVLWRLRDFDESGVRHGEGLQSQHEVNEPCVVIDLRRGETVCADLGRPSAVSTSKAEDWDGDGDGDEDNDDCEVIEPQLSGGAEGLRGPKQASISDALPSPVFLFDLPYRMIYAVATIDCVYLYDTQQASPIAMFANLHYAPFTDLAWSPDGQTLVLSAEDGYCTVVAFDEHELGIPHDLDGADELPALPATMAAFDGPIAVQPPSGFATVTTPASAALPALFASMTEGTALLEVPGDKRAATNEAGHTPTNEPLKKKKKAVLVHHGPLGSSITG